MPQEAQCSQRPELGIVSYESYGFGVEGFRKIFETKGVFAKARNRFEQDLRVYQGHFLVS